MVPIVACQVSTISVKKEQVLSLKSITTTSNGTKVIANDEAPSEMIFTPLTLQPLPLQQSTIVYYNSGMRLSNSYSIII